MSANCRNSTFPYLPWRESMFVSRVGSPFILEGPATPETNMLSLCRLISLMRSFYGSVKFLLLFEAVEALSDIIVCDSSSIGVIIPDDMVISRPLSSNRPLPGIIFLPFKFYTPLISFIQLLGLLAVSRQSRVLTSW
jgi:hypothetical protein